jgi:type IV secretion system protein VirB9
MAEGAASHDIAPSLVFDDGRFTYLRIAGQRELPAVFQVLADGSESLVNTRMEDDLLVVDRVSRRLVLRAGQAVVGIWNDAFDPDGIAPVGATTVPGLQRVIKAEPLPRAERHSGGAP